MSERLKMMSLMASVLMPAPIGMAGYDLDDYHDPDAPPRPRKKDYRIEAAPMSEDAMAENQRIAAEKQARKESDDMVMKHLKEQNPGLSGKALRKKLKEHRRLIGGGM